MSTEEFNHQLATFSFDQSSAPLTKESAIDKKSKQSGRAIRSWIFTKGYARRTRHEDSSRHVECLVSGCGKKYTSHDGSTSNIGRHLLRAHGIAKDGISAIKVRTNFVEQKITRKSPAPALQGAKASPESLNRKLIEFTLDFGLPLEIFESASFKEVLRAAQRSPPIDTLSLPSSFSLQASVSAKYLVFKAKVSNLLQNQESLSLTLRLISTTGDKDFLEISAHFIDDTWNRREVLIGYEYPEGSYSGANLADSLVRVLDDFGVAGHLFTITSDDSPMVVTMLKELEILASQREDLNFTMENQHIPCIASIMSSAIQKALTDGLSSKAPGQHSEEEIYNSSHEIEPLTKTRFGIFGIMSSNMKVHHYQTLCQLNYEQVYALKLDCTNECNSTIYFIERLITTKEAYNETCDFFEDLAPYKLDESDLVYLQRLYLLLSNFKELSEFLSLTRFPSLNEMIPAYHMLIKRIDAFNKSESSYPMRTAAFWAHNTLNSFYNTSTNSTVYSITTAMDPLRKFEYWDELGWGKDLSDKARSDVIGVWNAAFKSGSLVPSTKADDDDAALMAKFTFKKARDIDELERYLSEATLTETPNRGSELEYWSRSSLPFPNLSKMARKYLAVPATSLPCPRLFSPEPEILSVCPIKTKPSIIRICTLLKSWTAIL